MTLRRVVAGLVAFALIATACGSDGGLETTEAVGASAGGAPSVEEIGEENQALLEPADDARDVQLLDVNDGSISTLRQAVEGDRPVLLWFFAPH